MELILNTNELGYMPFLNTSVDAIIVGLKDFCINQPFSLSTKELLTAIKSIKNNKKKIYLSVNFFATEKNILRFKKTLNVIKDFEIDGYIVSDLGVLNIFKNLGIQDKVTLDLQTYITNKYSAKSLINMGISKISLSKEITLNDIKTIANFNSGKIDLLVQGYYPITYSKRPILNCYLKNFKLKRNNTKYFIKEESRQEYYPLIEEKNGLLVYNSKQYSLFNELPELINNVSSLRIDTIFLSEKEIKEYIEIYRKAIQFIENNKLTEYIKLKDIFNNKYIFDTPFLYSESFLLKEGK